MSTAQPQVEFSSGLEGVIVATTRIGFIDGQRGRLIYRGYDIEDLAKYSNFEETVYLLLYGRLPTREELARFTERLRGYRPIPDGVIEILKRLPKATHPMAALRTAVSALGCLDSKADDISLETQTEIGIKLIAQMATVAAAIARVRKGEEPMPPNPELNHAANFLYMSTGKEPDDYTARVMDVALILHADHGMNASTFTSMVTASSLSDIYSAVTAGIGSLKGPLHGGANEQAMKMFFEIGYPDRAEGHIRDALAKKRRIPGFGHRVYRTYDPRMRILKEYARELSAKRGIQTLYQIAERAEEVAVEALGERGIYPNVDFYSGIVYYSMGLEPEMYTPIFAVSRVAGWVARVLEYLPEIRIYRPLDHYLGPTEAVYVPMDRRA